MSSEITLERADRIEIFARTNLDNHIAQCGICQTAPCDPEGGIWPDCDEYWDLDQIWNKWAIRSMRLEFPKRASL